MDTHFLAKFTESDLNFGTEIELPSGRKFLTGSFDAVQIVRTEEKGNPLPITVKVGNRKMVHVTFHRTMEEAELAIISLAYFCDSTQFYEDVRREVEEDDAREAAELEEDDLPMD